VTGWARIIGTEERLDATPAAIYPWWSFTKTILAAAAFKLAEQGRLALDEPFDGKPYTLRQLLAHRAGLRDYGALSDYQSAVARGEPAWPVGEMLARANADDLLFAPGTGWSYSNIGYTFVRQAIERAVDAELRSALHLALFAPLGIHASMIRRREDMERLAFPHLHRYDPNWVYHGLVIGTAADAARLLHRLFTTSYLSEASRTAMFASVPLPFTLTGRPFVEPTPGTGLMIDPKSRHGMMAGHTGGGPGAVCAVYHFSGLTPPTTVAAFEASDDEAGIERFVLDHAA
jgi:CubicO group peptidase (beta-lactamase class C family)